MSIETEIVITPSARGYRFTLPEYCAPCPDAVRRLKQMSFLGYHKAEMGSTPYRAFPADKLDKVVDFLNYWYVEPNPLMPTLNRNGGNIIAVRVAEAHSRICTCDECISRIGMRMNSDSLAASFAADFDPQTEAFIGVQLRTTASARAR